MVGEKSECRADAFHEIAAKTKAAGMKDEKISDMTGLTSEEIEGYRAPLNCSQKLRTAMNPSLVRSFLSVKMLFHQMIVSFK